MSDKQTNEKADKDRNQKPPEPALFEEKTAGGSKWKTRLFLMVLLLGIGLIFWPKGYIKGEGIVQANGFRHRQAQYGI